MKNKKIKNIVNKKSILSIFFASILKFNFAVILLLLFLSLVTAGSIIVRDGVLNVSSNLYVDSSGKVGIGTTAPGAKLTVIGEINGSGLNISGNAYVGGNIGIGTSTPLEKLTIIGNVNVSNMLNATTFYQNRNLVVDLASLNNGTIIRNQNESWVVKIMDNGTIIRDHNTSWITSNVGGTYVDVAGDVMTGSLVTTALNVSGETLLATSSGKVGIGTATPLDKLHLADGLLRISGNRSDGLSLNVSNVLFVNGSSQRVGIGTTSPIRSLQLTKGDTSNDVIMGYTNISGIEKGFVGVIGTAGSFVDNGAIGDFFVRGQQDLHLLAGTGGTDQMILKTTGNVGIGTTNPLEKLTVIGNVNVSGMLNATTFYQNKNAVLDTSTYPNLDTSTLDDYNKANFTTNYATTGAYNLANFSSHYALTGAWNLANDSAQGYLKNNSDVYFNKVGIGTAIPLDKLHLADGLLRISGNRSDGLSLNVSNVLFVNGSSQRVGIGTTSPGARLDVADYTATGATFEAAGTQLLRYKYAKGWDEPDSPQTLRYTATNSSGRGHGAFIINFAARDNSNAALFEMWNLGVQQNSPAGTAYSYITHRIGGSNIVRAFEVNNSGDDLRLEWTLSNSLASGAFNDGIEITVMELAAGHSEGHFGTFSVVNFSSRLGGTELTNSFVMEEGATSTGNTLVVDSNDRVGIGTTSPLDKLHLADGLLRISGNRSDGLSLNVSNVLFVNSSSGNVGIGTTSPGSRLHIKASANTYAGGLILEDDATTEITAITTEAGKLWIGNGTTANPAGAATRMVIQHDGNVGIGTTSPTSKLQVASGAGIDANISGLVYINSTNVGIGTTSPSSKTEIAGVHSTGPDDYALTGRVVISGIGTPIRLRQHRGSLATPTASQSGDGTGMVFQGHTGTDYTSLAYIFGQPDGQVPAASDSPGRITFYTTPDASATPTEKMVINNAGNVGIGTTSPGGTLDVSGNVLINTSGSAGALNVRNAAGTSVLFVNGSSGNVGIGNTTSPSTMLQLGTTTNRVSALQRFATGNAVQFRTWEIGVDYGNTNTGGTNYSFKIDDTQTVGADFVIRYDTGNVGIGTSSPNHKLDIEGANPTIIANSTTSGGFGRLILANPTQEYRIITSGGGDKDALMFYDGKAGATRMVIANGTGNVGIGTTSPDQLLHIDGGTGAAKIHIETDGTNQPASIVVDRAASAEGYATVAYANNGAEIFSIGLRDGDNKLYIYDEDSSTTRLVIDEDKVGIGTASPSGTLDVSGNVLINTSGAAGALNVRNAGGTSVLFVNGSSGNVGIGTTNPASPNLRLNEKLAIVHAANNQYGGMSITNYGGANAAVAPILDLQKSRGTTDGSMTAVLSGDRLGVIVFRGADGTNFIDAGAVQADVDGTPGTNDMPARLTFWTTPDNSATTAERMRIDSAGKVGIGTASPGGTLDISGNVLINTSGSAGALNVRNAAGTSILFVNGSSGNIGINTTSPSDLLTIVGGDISISNNRSLESASGTSVSLLSNGVFRFSTLATAPPTCAIGDLYFDDSGAVCVCKSTLDGWNNLYATGTCA